MTCHDVDTLLPLFFDGELDAGRMRSVALHTARCAGCESQLRALELIQTNLQQDVSATLETIDFGSMWSDVERRLPAERTATWQRLRARWEMFVDAWEIPVALPAAAVAALALLSFYFFTSAGPTTPTAQDILASTDYASSVERLDTVFDSVAIFSDPDTQTTVLWVGDETLGDEP